MATSWKSQQDLNEGKYYLQFETDDKEKYKQIEKLCQELMDSIEAKNKSKCSHNWVYIGLDEYRCSKCKAHTYT